MTAFFAAPTRETTQRFAALIAVGTGAASWVAPYWIGLTAALAALTLAIELIRWSDAKFRTSPRTPNARPVLPVAGGTVGWALFIALRFASEQAAGLVLGLSAAGVAWSPVVATWLRRGP